MKRNTGKIRDLVEFKKLSKTLTINQLMEKYKVCKATVYNTFARMDRTTGFLAKKSAFIVKNGKVKKVDME